MNRGNGTDNKPEIKRIKILKIPSSSKNTQEILGPHNVSYIISPIKSHFKQNKRNTDRITRDTNFVLISINNSQCILQEVVNRICHQPPSIGRRFLSFHQLTFLRIQKIYLRILMRML